jgi:hypothetical protein
MRMGGWRCPNEPSCGHAGAFHDVEDTDDAVPMCVVDGCVCGHESVHITKETFDLLVYVASYVSAGRRFRDVEPYPDATARRALGALSDDLLTAARKTFGGHR